MENLFTPDAWNGGFYELALEFDRPSPDILDNALRAVWASPALQGCYLQADIAPERQMRIAPAWKDLDKNGHLYGLAALPSGATAACGVCRVREDSGRTWLVFYLPLGSLAEVLQIDAYPFEEERSREWREPLENWLAQLGKSVFAASPFLLGLVGHEVSGFRSATDLAASGVPERRGIGYLYPTDNQLTWYPTNQWQHKHLLAS